MADKSTLGHSLAIGGVLIVGALLLAGFGGEDSHEACCEGCAKGEECDCPGGVCPADAGELPTPDADLRPGAPGGFDEPYEASATTCDLDGMPYNAAKFTDPATVAAYLRQLGYIGVTDSLTGAANREKIKAFQHQARLVNLTGYMNAPESYIDGIVGECTLRAIDAALDRQEAGNWWYQP